MDTRETDTFWDLRECPAEECGSSEEREVAVWGWGTEWVCKTCGYLVQEERQFPDTDKERHL
jgi:rubrerythrin